MCTAFKLWVDVTLLQVFCEVHFGNHFALEGVSKKKSDICRWAFGRGSRMVV